MVPVRGPLEVDRHGSFMSPEKMEEFRKDPSKAPPIVCLMLRAPPEQMANFVVMTNATGTVKVPPLQSPSVLSIAHHF